MPVEDIFKYTARWDSVGLDCSYCIYEANAVWPNIEQNYACQFHNCGLSVQLGQNGYKEGEWFCKCFAKKEESWITKWFKNPRRPHPDAIMVFKQIKNQLNDQVLYKCEKKKYLAEIPFKNLPPYLKGRSDRGVVDMC